MAEAKVRVEENGSFRTPDFSQFYAGYTRFLGEFGKAFTNGQAPLFDVNSFLASQRKNVEAFSVANQLALEGFQIVLQRQVEMVRQAVQEFSDATRDFASEGSTEEKLARQTTRAKEAYENAVGQLNEVTQLVQKSNADAAAVLSRRVAENFDEVKDALQKTTFRA